MENENKDSKYMSKEEFNNELKKQVDSVKKMFEDFEKSKKDEGNER